MVKHGRRLRRLRQRICWVVKTADEVDPKTLLLHQVLEKRVAQLHVLHPAEKSIHGRDALGGLRVRKELHLQRVVLCLGATEGIQRDPVLQRVEQAPNRQQLFTGLNHGSQLRLGRRHGRHVLLSRERLQGDPLVGHNPTGHTLKVPARVDVGHELRRP